MKALFEYLHELYTSRAGQPVSTRLKGSLSFQHAAERLANSTDLKASETRRQVNDNRSKLVDRMNDIPRSNRRVVPSASPNRAGLATTTRTSTSSIGKENQLRFSPDVLSSSGRRSTVGRRPAAQLTARKAARSVSPVTTRDAENKDDDNSWGSTAFRRHADCFGGIPLEASLFAPSKVFTPLYFELVFCVFYGSLLLDVRRYPTCPLPLIPLLYTQAYVGLDFLTLFI
jgi:hypothetical protein